MERVPYWNISYGVLIDLLALPAMAIFAYGLYGHWRSIKQGRARVNLGFSLSDLKFGPLYVRGLLTKGILGTRLYRKLGTGIAHGSLLWGMVLLTVGTVLVFANVLFDLPVFSGNFNRWVMGFTLDLAGLAALLGTLYLLFKRLRAEERLVCFKSNSRFILLEVAIVLILVSGFLIEGFRISLKGQDPGSFVGNWIAGGLLGIEGAAAIHQYLWWAHGMLALALIAYIPFSPLMHIVLAPLNTGLDVPVPGPKMGVIDFEAFEEEGEDDDVPSLGIGGCADLSWKNRLDAATCLLCGRCHEVCPAAQTGKSLSPKQTMVALKEALHRGDVEDDGLLDAVSGEAIYSCTTCAACIEACPVSVNQPNAILGMRQHLLMERSEIPEIMGQAHRSLEARQHPFVGTGFGPNDWRKDLDVPIFEAHQTEYLLWIGCSVAYEERTQKIASAMVNILKQAGVSFGILSENRCTGDPAKQMGNEFLFTEIAGQNIEEFDALGIKTIITVCPHCYNSFTRHYPLLGGRYEVLPHASFLQKLIDSGEIQLKQGEQTICYHDPCYLGRHNDVLTDPRTVLSSVGRLIEMPRSGFESFCCGGGGGNYWSEEEGDRINQVRAREALDTGADTIATACPYCMLMLTDGLKRYTDDPSVADIAELVNRQLEG